MNVGNPGYLASPDISGTPAINRVVYAAPSAVTLNRFNVYTTGTVAVELAFTVTLFQNPAVPTIVYQVAFAEGETGLKTIASAQALAQDALYWLEAEVTTGIVPEGGLPFTATAG